MAILAKADYYDNGCKVIYRGSMAKGLITRPYRQIFEKGVPTEVTSEMAKELKKNPDFIIIRQSTKRISQKSKKKVS